MQEILSVRLQKANFNSNLQRPREISERRCATAQYDLSGPLKPVYSVSAEAPRHLSIDSGYTPMNILSLQATPSLPISIMSNLIGPSYVAASASRHNNSPVPSQPWRDTLQYETHETAPWSCIANNAEPLDSQNSIYFHARESTMPQSGSGLNIERKTAIPGFHSNYGPYYPNTWNFNMWDPLASSEPFQPLRETSSLISVEMQRQPAIIGYEPLPEQEQDLNNNDGWEIRPFGHDALSGHHTRGFHEASVIPAYRQHSNMEKNWSLHRLPRPASKARAGKKGVGSPSRSLKTQQDNSKSAPTTPSGDYLNFTERRQSVGTITPVSRIVRNGSQKTGTETGSGPKHRLLSPRKPYPGSSGSISSPPIGQTDPFGVWELTTGNLISNKRTRKMSPEAKDHAARVRRRPGGACAPCKLSKHKCVHVLEEDRVESSRDPGSADPRPQDEGAASLRWKTRR